MTENNITSSQLEESLNKISPSWVPSNPKISYSFQKNDFFDEMYSFIEFNVALEGKGFASSPVPDGITYQILRKMDIKYKLLLLDILNEIHVKLDFPSSSCESFVHFIPKAGSSGLRPISLTSCVCKLYEIMTKLRLQWWVEHFNLLSKSQQGFRAGGSCADNLLI